VALCSLGEKKIKAIERATGRPVANAFVRGSWEHRICQVHFADGKLPCAVWFDRYAGRIDRPMTSTVSSGPPKLFTAWACSVPDKP